MRAAYIEKTGPVDNIQVGDFPKPEPKPGQVLVKVGAVSLNPINLMIRSGMVAMPMAFPYVLGCDLAGTVEGVGPGDTPSSSWAIASGGRTRVCSVRPGVCAEYAAVDESWLYPTPDNIPDTAAAAIALTGITAHLGLFRTRRARRG